MGVADLSPREQEIAELAFVYGFSSSREGFNGECAYDHLASMADGDSGRGEAFRDAIRKVRTEGAELRRLFNRARLLIGTTFASRREEIKRQASLERSYFAYDLYGDGTMLSLEEVGRRLPRVDGKRQFISGERVRQMVNHVGRRIRRQELWTDEPIDEERAADASA